MKLKFFSYLFVFILLFSLGLHITIANQEEDKPKTTTSNVIPLTDPLGGNKENPTTIPSLLGKIIKNILGIIGSLALVMFIYGGAVWMLSAGNQEQVTKGKNILIWATLGIVVIFSAYALVKFVLGAMTS